MQSHSHYGSLWRETYRPPHTYKALSGQVAVDVAIVGAGITGLTAAYLLKRAGKRVAVLEAQTVGSGTSGYTTAHMMTMVDADWRDLISRFGKDGATLARESCDAALAWVEAAVRELQVDCGFRRLPGYLFSENERDLEYLEKELEAAQSVGVEAQLVRQVPAPFQVVAAIRAENQAEFHPMPYLHALARAVDGDGSHVFEHSHVEEFTDGQPCVVRSPGGSVTAPALLLCTHTPLGRSMLHTMVAPYRSYVIAFRADAGSMASGLFWDTSDPYHYIRSAKDEEGELIVLGGADRKTGHTEDANEAYRELELYARQRFQVTKIEYRWSAQFYESSDGLPYIGHGILGHHTYMATGYMGDGTVFGTIAGITLADQVLGRENPWSGLYKATRFKPMASAKEFVRHNVEAAATVAKDYLGGAEVKDVSEIQAGQGRILGGATHKTAVYRDLEGKLYACSAVCTHLGCLVHWNPGEKTWDCPCHGSRFSPQGEVLEGPATAGLARREVEEPKP